VSRAESPRKHLAVHARKLALEPDLQILRRHRRSLLRRLEQAHRSALADHVHRNARMGPPVLISESWYKRACRARSPPAKNLMRQSDAMDLPPKLIATPASLGRDLLKLKHIVRC